MGILYRPGDGITYGVPDRYYEENVFRTMEREGLPAAVAAGMEACMARGKEMREEFLGISN